MNDQGVRRRSAFHLENPPYGCPIPRVRSQSINGFGREPDEAAVLQHARRLNTEDCIGRLGNAFHDFAWDVQFMPVLAAMAAKNVNPSGACVDRQLDVSRMVTHHEGAAQVNAVILRRLEQKIGLGLEAHAPILASVRATVDFSDGDSLILQVLKDVRIDTVHLLQSEDTSRNPVLIGDDEKQEAGLEPPAVTVIGEVVRLRDRLHWHESRPLFGKRVLVTRARKQASALVERLADLGAEGIELPTIAIEPLKDAHALDDAIGRAGKFDWVLFTSVNGVEAFFERAKATGASIPEDVRFGALGPATAQALRDRQARVDFLPTLFSSRGIAEAFAPHAASRPRVLLPRADIAPELLVRALEGLGAQVEQVVAYRTVAPAEAKATARKVIAEGIDVATFTSSSTVRNLYELLDGDLSAIERATIVCIGPVTAETARALGLRVDVVAAEHTVEGLVKALVAHFEKGGA